MTIERRIFKSTYAIDRRYIQMIFKRPRPGKKVKPSAAQGGPFRRANDQLRALQRQMSI